MVITTINVNEFMVDFKKKIIEDIITIITTQGFFNFVMVTTKMGALNFYYCYFIMAINFIITVIINIEGIDFA